MAEDRTPSASLLTVGTEVTSGQIVNTNAAWLSDQLSNLQIPVRLHLSVEDEERQIVDALEFAAQHSSLIFVTGGLGPTRDDLTRHAITKWLQQSLVFDENSWQRICQRLGAFGIPVAESNRQQCYFPLHAKILINEVGTANGFYAEHKDKKLWCLPGPPKEIHRIWQDHLAQELPRLVNGEQTWQLMRWQCLGKSESALGELVETAIKDTALISGYRPHIPYVEIKLWCPVSKQSEYQEIFAGLEQQLQPWLVTRNDEDLSILLLQELASFPSVEIHDAGSQGVLAERLGSVFRRQNSQPSPVGLRWIETWNQHSHERVWVETTLKSSLSEQLTLAVGTINTEGKWHIGLRFQQNTIILELILPYRANQASQQDRYRRYLAEKTMYEWLTKAKQLNLQK